MTARRFNVRHAWVLGFASIAWGLPMACDPHGIGDGVLDESGGGPPSPAGGSSSNSTTGGTSTASGGSSPAANGGTLSDGGSGEDDPLARAGAADGGEGSGSPGGGGNGGSAGTSTGGTSGGTSAGSTSGGMSAGGSSGSSGLGGGGTAGNGGSAGSSGGTAGIFTGGTSASGGSAGSAGSAGNSGSSGAGGSDVSLTCGNGAVEEPEQCDVAEGDPDYGISCSNTCYTVASPACVECELAGDCVGSMNGCLGPEDAPFTPAERTACFAVMRCMQTSNCLDGTGTLGKCYCGSLAVGPCGAAPFELSASGAPNGACAHEIQAGMPNVTSNQSVLANLTDRRRPAGAAGKRLNCDKTANVIDDNPAPCLTVCGLAGDAP